MDHREPGSLQGRQPDPAAEVGVPERPACWAGEHETISAGPGVGHQVSGQVRRDDIRNRYGALTSVRLGRPEHEPATALLVQLPNDLDRPGLNVDVRPPQRG